MTPRSGIFSMFRPDQKSPGHFERTLIYPNGPFLKYLKTGQLEDTGQEIPKLYIAAMRVRQSVTFVVADGFNSKILQLFQIEET